jgi:hypothetical protein
MAAPIALITKAGRTLYKNAKGRFISKTTYAREIRRGPLGKFKSKADFIRGLDSRGLENYLRGILGKPLGGGDWVSRVRRSSERFADILAEQNAL